MKEAIGHFIEPEVIEFQKPAYEIGNEVYVKKDREWGIVIGHRFGKLHEWERNSYYIIEVQHYFGYKKEYDEKELELWIDPSQPATLLGRFLCFMGWHKLESQPSRKGQLKDIGPKLLFWSFTKQKGIRLCTREGCDTEKRVYRTGISNSMGIWRKLSLKHEIEIDSLPED